MYKILYDIEKGFPDGVDLDQLFTEFPAITQVKEMMKKVIERANMIDYRYNQGNKRRYRASLQTQENHVPIMGSEDHSIMLDGILNDASDSLDTSEMT